jgi:hypothetical protein
MLVSMPCRTSSKSQVVEDVIAWYLLRSFAVTFDVRLCGSERDGDMENLSKLTYWRR